MATDCPPLQLWKRRLQGDGPIFGSLRSDPKRALELLQVKNLNKPKIVNDEIENSSIFFELY